VQLAPVAGSLRPIAINSLNTPQAIASADGLGVHAERTFTLRPTPDGLSSIVVSHETQVGPLPWLGRWYLAPRLRAANQTMFDDLARATRHGTATAAAHRTGVTSPMRA
jgi:hypothetical protein